MTILITAKSTVCFCFHLVNITDLSHPQNLWRPTPQKYHCIIVIFWSLINIPQWNEFIFGVIVLCGTVAYVPGNWQKSYISSSDFWFKIIIMGTQIISCLFYILHFCANFHQLCLVNASPWFTNISKFSGICNCEFVVCMYMHTRILIFDCGF